MEVLVGVTTMLCICLVLAMKWIVDLMEDNHNLQKQNIELLEELIAIKECNKKHKKQQLNG